MEINFHAVLDEIILRESHVDFFLGKRANCLALFEMKSIQKSHSISICSAPLHLIIISEDHRISLIWKHTADFYMKVTEHTREQTIIRSWMAHYANNTYTSVFSAMALFYGISVRLIDTIDGDYCNRVIWIITKKNDSFKVEVHQQFFSQFDVFCSSIKTRDYNKNNARGDFHYVHCTIFNIRLSSSLFFISFRFPHLADFASVTLFFHSKVFLPI